MSLSVESLEFGKRYILLKGEDSELFKNGVENGMEFELYEPFSKEPIRKGINDKPMCTIHVIARYKTYFQKLHQEWIDRGIVEFREKGK